MMLKRWSRLFGGVSVVLALAGLAGCEKGNVEEETTDVATSEVVAEPAPAKPGKGGDARRDHHRRPHGPAMLLGAALRELELTDAQRSTIEAELDALRESAPARPDHDAAHAALAAAVRSGQIDEGALLAKMAPPAHDTTRLAKAIGVLHETLTPAQRKELVDAAQAHMDRGGPGDHEHGTPGARGPRDDGARGPGRHARGPRGDDARGPGKDARGPRGDDARGPRGDGDEDGARGPGKHARGDLGHGDLGPMGHLLRGVSLSDAQRAQVKDAISKIAPTEAERDAMKAQHEALRTKMRERLATFAGDSFDASAFVAPPEGGAKRGPEKMFGRMVKALAAVAPILDETQRAELAKRIEEGPGAPWKGKGHGPKE